MARLTDLLSTRSKSSFTPGPILFDPGSARKLINNEASLLASTLQRPFSPDSFEATVKNPTQQGRITGLGTVFDAGQEQQKQTLADWMKEYRAGAPQAKANANQESQAIGAYYGSGPGSVQQMLSDMSRKESAATNLAVQRAVGRASRDNNLLRMNQGNSSYADNRYANVLGGIAADEARRQAARDRENYMTVLSGQQANLGQRNSIVDAAINRDLVPLDANQRFLANDNALLGSLNNLENANVSYASPTDVLNRRMGTLGDLLQLGELDATYAPQVDPVLPPAAVPPAGPVDRFTGPLSQQMFDQRYSNPGAHYNLAGGSFIQDAMGRPVNQFPGQAFPFTPPEVGAANPNWPSWATDTGVTDPTEILRNQMARSNDPRFNPDFAADQALLQEGKNPIMIGGLRQVQSVAEYQALPSGRQFIDPSGNRRTKP